MNVRISDEWRDKLIAAGFPKEELSLGVAEEILRRLPKTFKVTHDHLGFLVQVPDLPDDLGISIDGKCGRIEANESLANAAAAMWCYLSDKKLLA